MVEAPRTDGTPDTGSFGVGDATITIGDGVGVAVTTMGDGVGVAVTTMGVAVTTTVTGFVVGMGVAVRTGQIQFTTVLHSDFLQRLIPSTDAQISPLWHPASLSQDASQTPGAEGGFVAVGVIAVGVGWSVR